MYSFKTRVRYSEVDKNKHMTLGSLINYFQDCSTFHSESIGAGIETLEEKGTAWVLSSWQIIVDRYPKLFEEIEVCTLPYDFKGFFGMRNFYILDTEGNMIAKANSIWIYMDMVHGRPVKIPKGVYDVYGTEEKIPMDYSGRKLPLPKDMTREEAVVIMKHQIDTNDHVNNGQYIQMAADYLPDGFKTGQLRAEYKMSAKLGDVLYPYIKEDNGIYTIALCDENEKPYAVAEFTPGEGV